MILRDLDGYLRTHRRATLGDIALHFDVPVEAARGMLDIWIRKGRVRKLEAAATCNTSCPTSCDDAAMTIYESVDAPAPRRPLSMLPMLPVEPSTCRHGSPLA